MVWCTYAPQTNLAKGWSGLAMEHSSCWILSESLWTDIWNSVEVGGRGGGKEEGGGEEGREEWEGRGGGGRGKYTSASPDNFSPLSTASISRFKLPLFSNGEAKK